MRFFIIIMSFIITSCTLGDDYKRQSTPLLQQDKYKNTLQNTQNLNIKEWWIKLNDPFLNTAIKTLDSQNYDLKAALERIEQAKQGVIINQSNFSPSLSLESGTNYISQSQQFNGVNLSRNDSTIYNLGINALWQIDLFGKLRRNLESSYAAFEASKADYQALRLSLISNLIMARIDYAILTKRIEVSQKNQSNFEKTVKIVENRYNLGIDTVSAADVLSARENLLSIKTVEPQLKAQRESVLYLINFYLSENITKNQNIETLPSLINLPQTPPPAHLLDDRPDLKSAEFRLIAANANVGAAIADLYPNISIGGAINNSITEGQSIFNVDRIAYSLFASLMQTIFTDGRLNANIKFSEAKMRELAHLYEKSILNAWREVEDNLQKNTHFEEQLILTKKNIDAANLTYNVLLKRYERGIVSLPQVLEAQRRINSAEDNYYNTSRNLWQARINLYLSLGGAW